MFLSLFKASAEDRSPWDDFWYQAIGGRSITGQRVSADSAMRLSAVYACVRVLTETMACLPFCMYRMRADGSKEIITDHWLYRLLARRPNDWQTPFEWREMMQGHLTLRGAGYNRIIANSRGEIDQLVPVHPDMIKKEYLDNGSFRYQVKDQQGNEFPLNRGAIWELRGLSADGYNALSPIGVARESIGLGLAAQEYGARFFANDAKPTGGWIGYPGDISKLAKETIRETWQAAQSGINRGKMAVLDRGMDYHEIGLNNKDAQFIEARQFQVAEICRIFRVPPHMAGDLSRSTNNNIEWQSLEFVKFTMTPWAERWEASIEYNLLPDDEDIEIEFDMDNLERGDTAARSAYYTAGINAGWLTRNEARAKENLDPLDGLDEPLEPMNMQGPGAPKKPDQGGKGSGVPAEDDPARDDATAGRLQVLAMAAAERVARKECEQVQRAMKEGSHAELLAMYGKHAQFVAKCLAIPLATAQAYCEAQIASLSADELTEQFEARTRCALERLALVSADVCTKKKRA